MAVSFNPFASKEIINPYPTLALLRAETPVSWNEQLGGWLLTAYEDVKLAQKDNRLSAERVQPFSDHMAATGRPMLESMGKLLNDWLLFRDPPAHTPLRRLLVDTFTPNAIENLRPQILKIANELLVSEWGKREVDLMTNFAFPMPALVIAYILGVPDKDLEKFRAWSNDLATVIGNSRKVEGRFDIGARALTNLTEYFRRTVELRRSREFQGRLIDKLISAQDAHGVMTKDELIGTCILILFAGHETTMHLIGNGVALLLQNPLEHEKIRKDPGLIPSMVEEVLRYESSVFAIGRVAREDLRLRGKKISKGDRVFLMISAANRDPSHFPNSETFDVTRSPNRHLSFGYGIHFCIGAQLARVEAEVAFRRLLPLLEVSELVDQELDWDDNFILRGVKTLRIK
ncbi:MAG: cytochrome P450 [Pseudomonadota bacterium]|nr:cytochrome P450 [Pseudomonadota bacterium]